MSREPFFTCTGCDRGHALHKSFHTCPECGAPLTVTYDYEELGKRLSRSQIEARGPGVWRYFELLPLMSAANIVSLGEGGTFLQRCDRLAESLGIRRLYLKNETTNPTGSFIDRGISVAVSKAKENGVDSLSCVPTGNLGSSLAAYAARAGLKCTIFLSPEVDLGKLYQMIAYNADIVLESSLEAAQPRTRRGEKVEVVTATDPFLLEGEKTLGFEVCEQLGWTVPTRIIAPMGTGGLFSMIWKGLREAVYVGFVRDFSVMMTGVQSEGCCPIVEAFVRGRETVEPFREPKTIAIDIRVPEPPMGHMALRAIRDSKGTATSVSDSEILEATRILAKTEGIFAEPAAASTVAGLRKLVETGEIDRDEVVVCVITGAGLKDLSTARKIVDDRRSVRMFVHGVEGRGLTTKLGETKMQILGLLERRDLHGYGIWRSLRRSSLLEISLPSVYQHLSELELLGLLRRGETYVAAGNRRRRYYAITEKGRETLSRLEPLRT